MKQSGYKLFLNIIVQKYWTKVAKKIKLFKNINLSVCLQRFK